MHRDPHFANHVDDVFDLFGIDDVIRQVVIDLVIRQEALFLAFGDEPFELRLLVGGFQFFRGIHVLRSAFGLI